MGVMGSSSCQDALHERQAKLGENKATMQFWLMVA
jgi:hypothetical protein